MGEILVATKSLIFLNKKVLLIKRSDYYDTGENEWEFPGGVLDFGEDLADGLSREIREEVGLSVRIERLLYAITRLVTPQKQIVGLIYLSHAFNDNVVLSHEHKDFIWATRIELVELLEESVLKDLIANSILDLIDID